MGSSETLDGTSSVTGLTSLDVGRAVRPQASEFLVRGITENLPTKIDPQSGRIRISGPDDRHVRRLQRRWHDGDVLQTRPR